MSMIRSLFAVVLFLGSFKVLAHGEDKPGPHGGFLQMPGAFHVEVVPTGSASMKVYLLDIEWKNPTIKDSVVKVSIKKELALCKAQSDFYLCRFTDQVDLKQKSEMVVEATREKVEGQPAIFQLPLKHR